MKEVYDHIEGLAENDELGERIKIKVEKLKKFADDLKELEKENFPETCNEFIDNFNDSLSICQNACATIGGTGKVSKFIKVSAHKKELTALEAALKTATENL